MKEKATRSRYGRRLWQALLLGVVLSFWGGVTAVAYAHANLVKAEPAPNSVLTETPDQVTVWFTETLEPQFGTIQVLNSAGQRVDEGDSFVDAQDPTRLSVALHPLDNGTYTVLWSNVSTVDGHKVRGSFVFSIGEPINAAAQPQLPDEPLVQSPFEPVWRWLTLVSVMLMVGGLGFHKFITQPVFNQMNTSRVKQDVAALWQQRSQQIIWMAAILFVAASCAQLILQTTITYDLPLGQVLERPLLNFLLNTGWGTLWLWRLGLLLLLLAALKAKHRLPERFRQDVPLVIGGALLLTLSLVSHAAATEAVRAAAIFNDFLHLVAATFWVGGLVHFAAGIWLIRRQTTGQLRKTLLTTLVARFSKLGLVSVAVLGMTGLYSGWAQVTIPAALATPYGRFLLIKLGLVIGMLALAALNLFWVRPLLEREERGSSYLARLVSGEVILALLVLVMTGLLTALEPARQVASRLGLGQPENIHFTDAVADLTLDMRITPGQVGTNQALVSVTSLDNQPINYAADVSLQMAYLETDLGNSVILTTATGQGTYEISDLPLTLDGLWQVILTVRRPNAADARTAFRFDVEPPTLDNSAAIAPTTQTGQLLWAGEWLLLGVAIIGFGLSTKQRRRRWSARAILPGLAAMGMAVVLLINVGPAHETEAHSLDEDELAASEAGWNPFLSDNASLAVGQQVYEDHCMICHGLTGHGDGPRSAGTDAVDIIEHVPLHADTEYFDIVATHDARGDLLYSPGPISEDEIWHLVNYLHVFETDQLLAEVYFSQARNQAEQGAFTEALMNLDQAIELSPRFLQALQGRGLVLLDQGDVSGAVADLSRVVALDPAYSAGYFYRAEAYLMAGDWSAAIDDYTQVIALEPDQTAAYYSRGLAQAEVGAVDGAVADLQRYLAMVPESGNRTAVEALLARLQDTPETAVSSATLLLTDLPAGFAPYPTDSLGLLPGSSLSADTIIDRSFAFARQEPFVLVWGFTTAPMDEAQQAAFDVRLQKDDLVAFIGSGLQAESVSKADTLPGSVGLADASVGVTAVFTGPGLEASVQGIAFRRGSVGAMIFVMTAAEETTQASALELAQLLANRITP